jgi:fructokinase
MGGSDQGVVLVGGEALYDLVLDSSGEIRGHAGGGPFNAARTVGRLGQPASYLGRLSRDRLGRTLAAILTADGVALDAVVETDDPTTLALAEVDDLGVARYRFYERGTSAPGLTARAALDALPEAVAILHVGTLGLTLEPMASALEAVAAELAGSALVSIDPNIRPWVIGDEDVYRERLRRVLGHSHVVKVSEEDVDWLYPGRPAPEAARALLDDGPGVALLTRGGEGVLVVTGDEEVSVEAPKVEVVDTIGAGDAFAGGFLAWWRARELGPDALADLDKVVDATAFGCLVAARTVARAGAFPPHLHELGTDAKITG